MLVLGINDGHNATAAILKDGRIIACASEERFSRLKNDGGYPSAAVDCVLRQAGVSPGQLDLVGLATRHFSNPIQQKIKREASFKVGDYIREMHEYWKPLLYENTETNFWETIKEEPRFKANVSAYDISFMKNTPKQLWADEFNKERIRFISSRLGISPEKIHIIDHHTGHAYYAYYASPLNHGERAAIVTVDSWGDDCNASISIAENGSLKTLRRTNMCMLTTIYRWVTLLLAMRPHEHEYKVMGLAPYAKSHILEPAYRVFKETLAVDGIDFKWRKKPPDMYFYFRDKFEGIRFDGIAGALQLWLEEMLAEWIGNILDYTGAHTLYYSGGLSLNVKANKTIAGLNQINGFYVPPSGGDESLAMGAAFKLASDHGERPYPLEGAYLGYKISEEESRAAAQPLFSNPEYHFIDNPGDDLIAKAIAEGLILARCVGAMEFGARALGNRSIIADPSKYENIRIINEKIKFRDFWMPFTPSILDERLNDYIVNPKNIQADYMTIAFDSTPLARSQLKAAIHPHDYTVRPQSVNRRINPSFHSLIKAFEKRSGIGAVLNTSFNLHGSPIICNARGAVEALVKSGLDGLILPGLLILKRHSGRGLC